MQSYKNQVSCNKCQVLLNNSQVLRKTANIYLQPRESLCAKGFETRYMLLKHVPTIYLSYTSTYTFLEIREPQNFNVLQKNVSFNTGFLANANYFLYLCTRYVNTRYGKRACY